MSDKFEGLPVDAFYVVSEDGYNWEPERYVSFRAAHAGGSSSMDLNPGEVFYIGAALPGNFPSDLAATVIQSIYEYAQMMGSKLDADDYVCNVSDDAVASLNDQLVDAMEAWGRKNGTSPNWFKVVEIEEAVVLSSAVGSA